MDFQDSGFARKVGYAQQQDLHLSTSTVREALEFSALMRQSSKYSRGEKLACVDEVIETLGMGNFADAIIGVPGEGTFIPDYHCYFWLWVNTDAVDRAQC